MQRVKATWARWNEPRVISWDVTLCKADLFDLLVGVAVGMNVATAIFLILFS
jgi:MFS superfamily sulfate permease-like transporter